MRCSARPLHAPSYSSFFSFYRAAALSFYSLSLLAAQQHLSILPHPFAFLFWISGFPGTVTLPARLLFRFTCTRGKYTGSYSYSNSQLTGLTDFFVEFHLSPLTFWQLQSSSPRIPGNGETSAGNNRSEVKASHLKFPITSHEPSLFKWRYKVANLVGEVWDHSTWLSTPGPKRWSNPALSTRQHEWLHHESKQDYKRNQLAEMNAS